MRKLLASILFLLPAAAMAAKPAPAAPAVSVSVPAISIIVPSISVKVPATPAVSVTVPAVSVTVPSVSVKVPAVPVAPAKSSHASIVTTTIPAAGLDALDLTARVGSLRITAGDTDKVKINVQAEQGGGGHFIFTWTTGPGSGGPPANLHLVAHRDGKTLTLCLATDSCEGSNTDVETIGGWKADWQIVVPRRFHVTVKGGVLDAHVRGTAGGLDMMIGVGKLSAYVPVGPVSAKIGVGKLEVAVASPEYGSVHLATGVGDASFTVAGKKITAGLHREFTSSSQETTGSGKVSYDLKAGTGSVKLALGAPRSASGGGDSNE